MGQPGRSSNASSRTSTSCSGRSSSTHEHLKCPTICCICCRRQRKQFPICSCCRDGWQQCCRGTSCIACYARGCCFHIAQLLDLVWTRHNCSDYVDQNASNMRWTQEHTTRVCTPPIHAQSSTFLFQLYATMKHTQSECEHTGCHPCQVASIERVLDTSQRCLLL